jgi:hypothetical protein
MIQSITKWTLYVSIFFSLKLSGTNGAPTIRPTISPTALSQLPSPFWPQPVSYELTKGDALYLNNDFKFVTTFQNEVSSITSLSQYYRDFNVSYTVLRY